MKIVILAIFILLFGTDSIFSQEREMTEHERAIIEFWKKEKFHLKAEEMIDRINNPEKYKTNDDLTLPELQSDGIDSQVSVSNIVESEVHAAINPTNPQNIVVSPINQNTTNPMTPISCPVYYTKDMGVTWQKSDFLTKPQIDNLMIVGGGDPVLVFDGSGKLYLSWINVCVSLLPNPENQGFTPDSLWAVMHYAVSEDGGMTFDFDNSKYLGKVVKSKYTGSSSIAFMLDKQWMAADVSPESDYFNNVYTSSMQMDMNFNSPDFGVNILVFRKPANSNEFIKSGVNITKGLDFQFVQFGALDVDLNGYVHLIFAGAKSAQASFLYHSVSKDGGLTFSVPKTISQFRGTLQQFGNAESVMGLNPQRLYPCPYIAVDRSAGEGSNNIYVTWTANGVASNASRGLDVYISKSSDGGDTWSTPKTVNQHPSGEKIHAYYSSINVSSTGVLSIAYYDRRHTINTASTHYYLAVSKDRGETFVEFPLTSVPMNFANIGARNNNFGIGEYNAVVSNGKTIMPVWADGRTNDGNINIYMAKVDSDNLHQYLTSVPDEIVSIYSNLFVTKLYPNPANESLNIETLLNKVDFIDYAIYDITGEVLISGKLGENLIGANSFDINVKSLASGQYLLGLTSVGGSVVRKFTIMR